MDPKPKFDTHIITDPDLFTRLMVYESAIKSPYMVIDTETNSKSEKVADLYGIGICFNEHKAFYIPWRNKDGGKFWYGSDEGMIISWLKEVCTRRKIINHNILYDVLVLENNLGFSIVDNIYSDTILQKHTLDEEPPFALKEVAVNILGDWADKAQQDLFENIKANGGKTTKDNIEMYKADTAVLAEYCCWDVLLTYMLFKKFEERINKEGLRDLFETEVMPLYKLVTINMKRKGFTVDVSYFEALKTEIQGVISQVEDDIMNCIEVDVKDFCNQLLAEEYPVKNAGNFPKALASVAGIPLPVNAKTGEITLAKKAIEQTMNQYPKHTDFYKWILGINSVHLCGPGYELKAQQKLFFDANSDRRYIFNLKSTDHLIGWLVNKWLLTPLETTDKGKPRIDDDFLEHLVKMSNPRSGPEEARRKDIVSKLLDFKRLNKLISTYVEGILERQIDGVVYTSMLQFGTTSGRYSSRDPNLQNIPRVKDPKDAEELGISTLVLKYVNAVKKGFVAPPGYKIVNADYSSLEPVCFAHMSNEEKLRDIFRTGKDLYSQVAIDVNKLQDQYSSDKKADNFLKRHKPELRQLWKVPTLGIVYGMEENRLVEAVGCTRAEASKIINGYLDTYPNLRSYMKRCDYEAKNYGMVKTEFGRIRHLRAASSIHLLYGDEILNYKYAASRNLTNQRREYKNLLNNAKNFKIQGLAAHIVNRSAIAMTKKFLEEGLDASIRLQTHDELTVVAKEDQTKRVAEIMQDCMEKTTIISVPLKAEPLIAENWADAK